MFHCIWGCLTPSGNRLTAPGRIPSPGSDGILLRSLVEELEPHTDAEERHAAIDGGPGRPVPCRSTSVPAHTGRTRPPRAAPHRRPPRPGPDRRPTRRRRPGAGGPFPPTADCRCRSRGRRSPVGRRSPAGSDPRSTSAPGGDHSVPLVEGMPPPWRLTASRKARATPLKDASTMWWVFFPVRSRMWRVSPPAVANARQNSSASWGSKGGVPRAMVSGAKLDVVDEERSAGKVEGHLDQRLVERKRDRPEPPDAGLVPQGVGQRLAHG